jgi:hypothetical protein
VVIDEIGGWLARILSKGQSGNVNEIPSHLQTLWGLSVEGAWMGTKKLGKEMQSWYSVAFAINGFSTEKMFFKALKDKLLSSGFVNRMLCSMLVVALQNGSILNMDGMNALDG